MYARVLTASLYGLSGELVWVEVDVENGLPAFSVVGLANQSIKEAKDRIHSAVTNCGRSFPMRRITVNLTPANKKKEGSHFDLPIAIGLLKSTGQLPPVLAVGDDTGFLGELTLDGRLAPCDGILPMVAGMQKRGIKRVFVPNANLKEAMLVKGMEIYAADNLSEAADMARGFLSCEPHVAMGYIAGADDVAGPDFGDIRGQTFVKRAAQVAAAGSHGLLMIGPPGVGKTMVGKRIPGILPPLTYEEQLVVTQIYSVAGELSPSRPMITSRPFRSPHHSMSSAAMTGGGSRPRPGEVSLAHGGVLFLDELPEFSAHTLETLRQPLEEGFVSIARVKEKCVYPAGFMLVAAMNPCRCGYYGDPVKPCTCSKTDRQRYMNKVSGPLLDRIDLHVAMERVVYEDITKQAGNQSSLDSSALREGVLRAVDVQQRRYEGLGLMRNSGLTPALIGEFCSLDEACNELMQKAFSRWALSARAYMRILKVARTIADIDGSKDIRQDHILEALGYRMPERYFG